MQIVIGNPATLAACGVPVTDLAGALITPEFIASLPPIQVNRKAERKFAIELSARVFGQSAHTPPKDIRPVVTPDKMARRYKTLTANWNYSPEVARQICRDEKMWRAVEGHRHGALPDERGRSPQAAYTRSRIRAWGAVR
jgi:hypothetical protein